MESAVEGEGNLRARRSVLTTVLDAANKKDGKGENDSAKEGGPGTRISLHM